MRMRTERTGEKGLYRMIKVKDLIRYCFLFDFFFFLFFSLERKALSTTTQRMIFVLMRPQIGEYGFQN